MGLITVLARELAIANPARIPIDTMSQAEPQKTPRSRMRNLWRVFSGWRSGMQAEHHQGGRGVKQEDVALTGERP